MTVLEKLATYKTVVDDELKSIISDEEPKNLYEPIREHIFAGGKRVRPALCLVACEAVSGDFKKAVPIATSLELVHAFTLVHDDIMDRDEIRRGQPTTWKKYGEGLAINAGDGIFTKAFESAFNLEKGENNLEIFKLLTKTIVEVCEGQALDMTFETQKEVTIEEYIEMANKKTGSLIKSSTELGAMIGGGTEEQIKALSKYGACVGLAFQIWDDYIDFASEKTGKTFGSDIIKGKKTSIVCHALGKVEETDKEKLLKILDTEISRTTPEMIKEATGILEKTGSIDYAKQMSFDLIESAKKALDVLEDSDAKQILLEFADYLVQREH